MEIRPSIEEIRERHCDIKEVCDVCDYAFKLEKQIEAIKKNYDPVMAYLCKKD